MKKIKENFTQNSLFDSEAANKVGVLDYLSENLDGVGGDRGGDFANVSYCVKTRGLKLHLGLQGMKGFISRKKLLNM